MTKIWQVEFISFSGASAVAYDTVGTQHLTTPNNITKATPVADFVIRPGVSFVKNSTVQYYNLDSSGGSNTTNAFISQTYTTRSFVMWIYLSNINNSSLYNTSSSTYFPIWHSSTTSTTLSNGFGMNFNNGLLSIGWLVGVSLQVSAPITTPGWHCFVATINKTTPEFKFYADGVLLYTGSSVPADSASVTRIGEGNTTGEETYQFGQLSTYDTVLNQSEVTAIYNDFLKDDLIGGIPYQSVSGTIYDTNNSVVPSGFKAHLLRHDTTSIVDYYTTTGDGYYQLSIPASGNYTIITTNPPNAGGRAVALNASTSGVYFY